MAVLEAMAAGCAVIASIEPISNRELLSEGRGFAIPVGDVQAVSEALIQAVSNLPHCREMGRSARSYIAEHHNSTALRRSLLQATFWSFDLTKVPTYSGQGESAS
jgi:glycosyltransferase involved in cell wall biosynthesis